MNLHTILALAIVVDIIYQMIYSFLEVAVATTIPMYSMVLTAKVNNRATHLCGTTMKVITMTPMLEWLILPRTMTMLLKWTFGGRL